MTDSLGTFLCQTCGWRIPYPGRLGELRRLLWREAKPHRANQRINGKKLRAKIAKVLCAAHRSDAYLTMELARRQ